MHNIYLHTLQCNCYIGTKKWEKNTTQKLTFDIDIQCDFSKAAHSDSIENTINYQEVAEHIRRFTEESHFLLLETLVFRLADSIKQHFTLIQAIKIKCDKGAAITSTKHVGVIYKDTNFIR